MKKTVDIYEFRADFQSLRPNNFSYEGLGVLFDMLESYEQDTGEEFEFDVIAICCDFTESTAQEVAQDYQLNIEQDEYESAEDYAERLADEVEEYLSDNTMAQRFDVDGETRFIYQAF